MSFLVQIKLKNNQTFDTLCVIPQGHIFENKLVGSGRQNVAAIKKYEILIPAGSSISVTIETLCVNRSYSRPSGPGNVSIFKINKPFSSQSDLWGLMKIN
jgi:hypothetical protein